MLFHVGDAVLDFLIVIVQRRRGSEPERRLHVFVKAISGMVYIVFDLNYIEIKIAVQQFF